MDNRKENKLDIVNLIEKNPVTHLSGEYQNNLITKIKNKFTNKEQQLFVANFYCFLNCSKDEFPVDLENVWKWIGFSRKDPAKRLLVNNFTENIDYKIIKGQVNSKGGRPLEQILMTINTFKKFCLKAGTSKADEIHDYYIKLEDVLREIISEETEELKNQLLIKENQLLLKDQKHKVDLKMIKHNTLVEKLKTKKCVYVGEIEENKLIKIGSSKQVDERTKQLTNEYGNLIFLEIFECDNFRETEENILHDPIVVKNLCKENVKLNGKKSREVIKLSDSFTYNQLLAIVKKYVDSSNLHFLTPAQLLEKEKIDLENKKLDYELLSLILKNDKYSADVRDLIKNNFPNTLHQISENEKHLCKENSGSEQIEIKPKKIIKKAPKKIIKK